MYVGPSIPQTYNLLADLVLERVREWLIRAVNGLGGLELLVDVLGLNIRKKIRVQVAILRDASTPLGMTATPSSAEGPLDEMQSIFWNEAHVSIGKSHRSDSGS